MSLVKTATLDWARILAPAWRLYVDIGSSCFSSIISQTTPFRLVTFIHVSFYVVLSRQPSPSVLVVLVPGILFLIVLRMLTSSETGVPLFPSTH